MGLPTYYTRSIWRPDPVVSGYGVPDTQFVKLAIHHTAMILRDYDGDGFLAGDLDDIVRYMLELANVAEARNLTHECPYSWVVFKHPDPYRAIVVEGRGEGRTGAHTLGHNSTAYGIAFATDTLVEGQITPGMVDAVHYIGARFLRIPEPEPTIGHLDVFPTECPGVAYELLPHMQPPFRMPEPFHTIGGDKVPTPATTVGAFARRRPLGITEGTYVVQADGGVFAYDGATFYGSLPSVSGLPARTMGVDHIVGGLTNEMGTGYWLLGYDGSIFAFGDAEYYGRGNLYEGEYAVELVPYANGYAIVTNTQRRIPCY